MVSTAVAAGVVDLLGARWCVIGRNQNSIV